jgi:hypothetical protein
MYSYFDSRCLLGLGGATVTGAVMCASGGRGVRSPRAATWYARRVGLATGYADFARNGQS